MFTRFCYKKKCNWIKNWNEPIPKKKKKKYVLGLLLKKLYNTKNNNLNNKIIKLIMQTGHPSMAVSLPFSCPNNDWFRLLHGLLLFLLFPLYFLLLFLFVIVFCLLSFPFCFCLFCRLSFCLFLCCLWRFLGGGYLGFFRGRFLLLKC